VPQCGGYFEGQDCDLKSEYKGVMGPLVADFDATISNAAMVWVRNTYNTSLCIQWTDMPLFRQSKKLLPGETVYTSTLCLYPPGVIRWQFWNFTGPPSTNWMVTCLLLFLVFPVCRPCFGWVMGCL
jgi:hypothetical protein